MSSEPASAYPDSGVQESDKPRCAICGKEFEKGQIVFNAPEGYVCLNHVTGMKPFTPADIETAIDSNGREIVQPKRGTP
jgi:hypothetical protein